MNISKRFTVLITLTFLFLTVFAGSTVKSSTTDKKPNIILIMADDLDFETIGCYGNTSYKTPRIDKMAEQGVKFEKCYSQPLCTPSRVKIMTGKSNFRNYERWGYLNQNETTFAHILKSQGYSTCIAGKWQLKGDEYAPYKAGFDEYMLWQLTFTSYNERYKNPRVLENGVMKKYNNSEYGPQMFTDFLLNFMERKKDGPFLVYYPMALTHRPFVPTPDSDNYEEFFIPGSGNAHSTKSDVKYFKDEVEYMDKLVGQIIDKTHELGISENTLILFVGDNGTNHGVFSQMGDKRVEGDKGATNEYGIHVPFVAYWDGKVQPSQVNNNLVDFSDFLPTFCEVAGVELNETFVTDGISFLPQITGEKYTAHNYLFCHFNPGKSDFPQKRFVHNGEWKLYDDGNIYNVTKDPKEENPIKESELNGDVKSLILTYKGVLNKMKPEEIAKE